LKHLYDTTRYAERVSASSDARPSDPHDAVVSAHDVARELDLVRPGLGVVQLHKLLWFCQGWHLALRGMPIFFEDIEAWEMGPVVADLWHDVAKRRTPPPPRTINPVQRDTVDYVVSRYGALSARELIHLTHRASPWMSARQHGVNTERIALTSIREHFAGEPEHQQWLKDVARHRARQDVYGFEAEFPPAVLEAIGRLR
jgi:uncharacterized phage-associated protein